MRSVRGASFVVAFAGTFLGAAPAPAADSGPVIVLPGRLGAPVLMHGVDVTGAVIEGDFGLYSPHMVNPTIIPAPVFVRPRFYQSGHGRTEQGAYFPAFGRTPGYGRHEIEPPADRRLPPPAQSFHRSWGIQSEPLPADIVPPAPPLIVSPQIYPGGRRDDDGPRRRP
ncbi:MAG TPA: hypothetical protein VIY51_21820 [Xanthobacteraceae bacterium]